MGKVENIKSLALELGYQVVEGALPSSYLGLPLGALDRFVMAIR